MAHYKRNKPRLHTHKRGSSKSMERRLAERGHHDPDGAWLGFWPAWWDLAFHRRPKRRAIRRMERAVLMGWLDPDAAAWPLGNHKPHNYYW